MPRTHVAAALTLLLCGAVPGVRAQSLAETARKEEERRQGVKSTSKVITNKDLTPAPPSSASPAPPAPADAAAAPSGGSPAADAKPDGQAEKDDTKDPPKDQKYWSGRMKQLQDQVQRDATYAEAMQSRINALTTDFVNRDDPAQRGVIGVNRQKAVEELDRLKKSVADGTKAIAALEDEARRAGVPAGWLR